MRSLCMFAFHHPKPKHKWKFPRTRRLSENFLSRLPLGSRALWLSWSDPMLKRLQRPKVGGISVTLYLPKGNGSFRGGAIAVEHGVPRIFPTRWIKPVDERRSYSI